MASSSPSGISASDSDELLCPPAYSSELPPSNTQLIPSTSGTNNVPTNPHIGYDWTSQPLEPSEVRWFFEDSKIKGKWSPFMGGDSLALETQYRAAVSGGSCQNVFVRGKLYEVDVSQRTCSSIYWPEESVRVLRGSWFNVKTWQPLAEVSADKLETKHAQLYPYGSVSKVPPKKPNEKPKSLGKVELEDCHVEWYSPVIVHAFKQNMMSKMTRSIGVDLLGISKISRGYIQAARSEQVAAEVSHLAFVVHGIGAKLNSRVLFENINRTRNLVAKYQKELYPDFNDKRVEFLPIEWRSKIRLDEGVLDSVTLRKMRRVRELGNASVLDVLFYTSPLYTEEILDTVVKEIHRQYNLFLQYNPGFVERGGKVSLIGHSLGSVICYDILRNYRTMDDFVVKLQSEYRNYSPPELSRYHELKNELLKLEQSIATPYYDSFGPRSLPFPVENYYAVGSPLGCFLALRGIKPSQNGSIDNLLPKEAASRFYNLFHPYDPVAFRLEPLLLPHYRRVRPVVVHHHSQAEKPPYEELQQQVYEDEDDAKEMQEMPAPSTASGSGATNARKGSGGGGGFFDGIQKELKKGSRQVKTTITEPYYSRSGIVGGTSPTGEQPGSIAAITGGGRSSTVDRTGGQMHFPDEQFREMNLEFRVDYELRAHKSIVDFYSGISTMPTAHIQYWESKDSAIFFLQTLMRPYQREPLSPEAKKHSPSAPPASSVSEADKKL
ncbi:phospholipase DDHD1-like isoform X2 [Convolutriloba macropyga]|uniref:phospholipase DDHD1-like isoform X2 n=1 Tax=Convolutriloba macropyga TaxID=536237 RepID=UPI003F5225A7